MSSSLRSDATTSTPTQLSLPVLLVIGCLTAIPPLVTDLYLPALPEMARVLDAPGSLTQLTMSLSLVGLALGQLVVGPLSDRVGRIRPLRWGLVLLAVTTLLCALAPNLWVLLVARLLQGLAGSAAVVIARAIVRDVYDGYRLAKVYSELMLVMGLAPVIGPVIGGQLLCFTDWRGTFVALLVLVLALLLASWPMLSETRHPDQRDRDVRVTAALWSLLTDVRFVAYLTVTALGGAVLFTYIVLSGFVLQNGYGLSPVAYSWVFGSNAIGLIIGSQINARLVVRLGPARMLTSALSVMGCASLLVAVAQALEAPLAALLVPLWCVLLGFGGVMANANALALGPHRRLAGTASALLGSANFLLGAAVPPLVSLAGSDGPVMGITMASAALLALLTLVLRTRADRSTAPSTPEEKP